MRVAVVQARMGSQRLPGKVLADLNGTPILGHVLERLGRAVSVDKIVVATSTSAEDDMIERFCAENGAECVRGSEYDVLERFGQVLDTFADASEIVRVTADCPFIDPGLIDLVVQARIVSGADFAANRLPPPYARTYPVGLDVEVATREALERARSEAVEPRDREHVMPYLYAVPGRFKVKILDAQRDYSAMRWTVDTPEDLAAVRVLAKYLPHEPYDWRDVLDVALAHPEIQAINGGIAQKEVGIVDGRWQAREECE